MTGYQQAILYLSGAWSGGKYLVRNVDRWYVDAVSDLFPTAPYFQLRSDGPSKRDYWCIKSAHIAVPALDEVRDWQGFCRGFVELQGTLDLWSRKNRKGDTIRTLRLRIYGQPDALDAVANNLPAGRKKMQICRTQNGVTYLYAYQSPSEVSAIITYLNGFPRNERIWQCWNNFL